VRLSIGVYFLTLVIMKNSSWLIIGLIVVILVIVGVIALAGNQSAMNNNNAQATGTPAPTMTAANLNTISTDNTVVINNFAFSPQQITVRTGTTVTWINQDSVTHQPVADSAALIGMGSAPLNTGDSYSYTFTQTGTWNYHCNIHPEMTGTVVVTE